MVEDPAWLRAIVVPGQTVADDAALMRLAIAVGLASIAHTTGGPFAALVTTAARAVVAVGVNAVVPSHDPTAHAEVIAIRRAAAALQRPKLAAHTLITTCAPCVMCAGAVRWAGLSAVVAGACTGDAEARGFVEGPVGFDVAAFLRARGVAYREDVERERAVELLRRYHGPIY